MRCHSRDSRMHCIQKKKRGGGRIETKKTNPGKGTDAIRGDMFLALFSCLPARCLLKSRVFALLGEVRSHCQKNDKTPFTFLTLDVDC